MTHTSGRNRLLATLNSGGEQLVNLKFFPGNPGRLCRESVANAVASAIEQRRDGRADVSKRFPGSTNQIDVQKVVARL
jgi:hypothetical protein